MNKKETNTGHYNSSNGNSGHRNSGHYNSSNGNSGDDNSGHCNSGDGNSGDVNSGDDNSGHCNSGDGNSGDVNSGDENSGHRNSGHRNSGDDNSGHCNSGNGNSGNGNSGHYNSSNGNSGFFNTDEPNVRMFNQDTGKKRSELNIPYIFLKVTEWISENNMTDEQKKNDPEFYVKGGTLIKRSYKEAWSLYWSECSDSNKQKFLDLPNFNAEIFEEITGIDVNQPPTCEGKIVKIDGKKYKLSEIK